MSRVEEASSFSPGFPLDSLGTGKCEHTNSAKRTWGERVCRTHGTLREFNSGGIPELHPVYTTIPVSVPLLQLTYPPNHQYFPAGDISRGNEF